MIAAGIFRQYDIRGIVGKDLTVEAAEAIGRAYAVLLAERGISGAVAVGRDNRPSGAALRDALVKGLTTSGLDVIDVGIVPTPLLYWSLHHLPVIAGIQITGSHNPPEYNGFKCCIGHGSLHGEGIQHLYGIIQAGHQRTGAGTVREEAIIDRYVADIAQKIGPLPKDMKVVIDCGNGVGAVAAPQLFKALGITPTWLFAESDGTFPNHHPDPTVVENLQDLIKAVRETGSEVGIGFDGDADRIGVVDHTGKMIYGDELMTIFARDVLSKTPGAKVVGDVKCSDRMYHDIAKNGGEPIMWKTGHSLIKEKIKVEKAPFGGEMSGHIFFADRNYGYDDAPYAGLRLCEILSRSGKTIPELLAGLPAAFNTPEIRIDTTEEKKVLIVEKVKEQFSGSKEKGIKVNLIDGIRISFEDGWALARASNTQPVLVVRFESNTAAGLKRIQDKVMSVVNQYL